MSESALVNWTRQYNATTANWAVTHSTSLDPILDLFFVAWAARNISEQEIIAMWTKAYVANSSLALKLLFWARDCRWWAWERRFFRVIWKTLDKEVHTRLEQHVPTFWRRDDIFETSLDYIAEVISSHDFPKHPQYGLLMKWLPRKWKLFDTLSEKLKVSKRTLRKIIVQNCDWIVERNLTNKDYNFDYSKVPSYAYNKYSREYIRGWEAWAFLRNDKERFESFIWNKETKVNSAVLFPSDIYHNWQSKPKDSLIKQWEWLPNYVPEWVSFLPVCDVSWSMTWTPMDVSVSLWVYLSERNTSVFKDAFITFSNTPEMLYLKWDVHQRFSQLLQSEWWMNTNIQATFDLILETATRESLTQEDLPDYVLIISDMEFDRCWTNTNYNMIAEKFRIVWYKAPKIVFWNVNWRPWNVPVSKSEKEVALVSWFSPAIIKSVLSAESCTPIDVMLKTLNLDRYALIN